ncbi:MAG: aminoacyl-tRNA hydrolase [Dehalococcoidia bacterium]|nr:aminoacyl-tRNA hydrolase [Dehalococcoidia bacterium]
MAGWYLIAGLGNPGTAYERTRHNAGFMVVEELAKKWGCTWTVDQRFNVRLCLAAPEGARCVLCQPYTYMNKSGEAVAAVARYYQISLDKLLIIVDDADLPLGELRMRPKGGTGGHHGLESVERHLGTREYPRLRLGIGRRPELGRQITSYVLGEIAEDEVQVFQKMICRAAEAAATWLKDGISTAMNRFNGPMPVPEQKKLD